MKKILVLFVACLVFSSVAFASFTDVKVGDFYFGAIEFLDEQDIVNGYQDGSFGYDSKINRAEMLKIVVGARFLNQDKSFLNNYSGEACFDDVVPNEWYTSYVCYAKSQGWVNGYEDGTFKPATFINFVEGLKIMMKVFGEEYPALDPWFKGVVDKASEKNLIPLTIKDFAQFITRAEMADLIARKLMDDEGELSSFLGSEKESLVVTYDSISKGEDLYGVLTECDGHICPEPVPYCEYQDAKYMDGDVLEKDDCTRCECNSDEFVCTDLCLSTRSEFSDYYEKVLDISNMDFAYDENGDGHFGFDLSNSGQAPIDNEDIRIYFLNSALEVLASYDATISVPVSGPAELRDMVVKMDEHPLGEVTFANMYLEGYYFGSVSIEPHKYQLSFSWHYAGTSYIDLLISDFVLADGQQFYTRCDSDNDPESPYFNVGSVNSIRIGELMNNTTYYCTVGLWEDDVKTLESEILEITTIE